MKTRNGQRRSFLLWPFCLLWLSLARGPSLPHPRLGCVISPPDENRSEALAGLYAKTLALYTTFAKCLEAGSASGLPAFAQAVAQ
jgi:hypothetical protein